VRPETIGIGIEGNLLIAFFRDTIRTLFVSDGAESVDKGLNIVAENCFGWPEITQLRAIPLVVLVIGGMGNTVIPAVSQAIYDVTIVSEVGELGFVFGLESLR